jgi:hypothetical protein
MFSSNQCIKNNVKGNFVSLQTEPLTINMAETDIKDAINSLPIFGSEESVTVVRQAVATPTYKITFDSKRGYYFVLLAYVYNGVIILLLTYHNTFILLLTV